MTRKLLTFTLLAALLLALAACGGGAPAESGDNPTAPAGGSSSAEKPTAKPEADAEPEADAAAEADAAPGANAPESNNAPGANAQSETRDFSDISGSLEELDSYSMRFTFSFNGKNEEGKTEQGSMEIVQEVIKASKDQHIRFSTTGDAAESTPGGIFEIFQVGGVSYMHSPEGQDGPSCLSASSDQNDSLDGQMFKPGDIVGGIENATLVKQGETVNGVKADHYTFDQGGVSFGTFSSAKGDVWVAQDGGYLLKYVGEASGKAGLFGSGSTEGSFTWEYNVENINGLEAITLPDVCAAQQPATDIPLPEGATDKANFNGIITFKSKDAPADVAAFFKQELPGQGWQAGEASELGDMQSLTFTKEGRTLSITITKEEAGGSSALLSETKE
jgi:hypothetical protein